MLGYNKLDLSGKNLDQLIRSWGSRIYNNFAQKAGVQPIRHQNVYVSQKEYNQSNPDAHRDWRSTAKARAKFQWRQHNYGKSDLPNYDNLTDEALDQAAYGSTRDAQTIADNLEKGFTYGNAAVLAGTSAPGFIFKHALPGLLAQKGSKQVLNYTDLSEDNKNLISGGIGTAVGFGSGSWFPRLTKGILDYTLWDKVYTPTMDTVYNHTAGKTDLGKRLESYVVPVMAAGASGTSSGVMSNLERKGVASLNNQAMNNINNSNIQQKVWDNFTIPLLEKLNYSDIVTRGGKQGLSAVGSTIATAVNAGGKQAIATVPITIGSNLADATVSDQLSNVLGEDTYEFLKNSVLIAGGQKGAQHLSPGKFTHESSSGAKDVKVATDNVKTNLPRFFATGQFGNYNGSIVADNIHYNRQTQGALARTKSGFGDGWLRVEFGDGQTSGNLDGSVSFYNGVQAPETAQTRNYRNASELFHKVYPTGLPERRGFGQKVTFVSPSSTEKLTSDISNLNENFTVFKGPKNTETRGDLVIGKVNTPTGTYYEYYNGDGHIVLKDSQDRPYYFDMGGTGSAGVNHNHQESTKKPSSETISETPEYKQYFSKGKDALHEAVSKYILTPTVNGVKTVLDQSEAHSLPVMLAEIDSNPTYRTDKAGRVKTITGGNVVATGVLDKPSVSYEFPRYISWKEKLSNWIQGK